MTNDVTEAKEGSIVKVHYKGTLGDGTVFDQSYGSEPFELRLGDGIAIVGFEKALLGMKVGEKKSVTIPKDEAYGDYDLELRVTLKRAQLPSDIEYQDGMVLQIQTPEGYSAQATVVEMDDENITLDGNHPLSGETLHFDIEMIEIL